jgi:hypothetical protein
LNPYRLFKAKSIGGVLNEPPLLFPLFKHKTPFISFALAILSAIEFI